MNHLTKEELEHFIKKLPKDKIGGTLISCYDLDNNYLYKLSIQNYYLGRNGYRVKCSLICEYDELGDRLNPLIKDIILNFTINGSFSNSGIHNPGPNYLKRKYYKVCQ
jgi:hypothetical protein